MALEHGHVQRGAYVNRLKYYFRMIEAIEKLKNIALLVSALTSSFGADRGKGGVAAACKPLKPSLSHIVNALEPW